MNTVTRNYAHVERTFMPADRNPLRPDAYKDMLQRIDIPTGHGIHQQFEEYVKNPEAVQSYGTVHATASAVAPQQDANTKVQIQQPQIPIDQQSNSQVSKPFDAMTYPELLKHVKELSGTAVVSETNTDPDVKQASSALKNLLQGAPLPASSPNQDFSGKTLALEPPKQWIIPTRESLTGMTEEEKTEHINTLQAMNQHNARMFDEKVAQKTNARLEIQAKLDKILPYLISASARTGNPLTSDQIQAYKDVVTSTVGQDGPFFDGCRSFVESVAHYVADSQNSSKMASTALDNQVKKDIVFLGLHNKTQSELAQTKTVLSNVESELNNIKTHLPYGATQDQRFTSNNEEPPTKMLKKTHEVHAVANRAPATQKTYAPIRNISGKVAYVNMKKLFPNESEEYYRAVANTWDCMYEDEYYNPSDIDSLDVLHGFPKNQKIRENLIQAKRRGNQGRFEKGMENPYFIPYGEIPANYRWCCQTDRMDVITMTWAGMRKTQHQLMIERDMQVIGEFEKDCKGDNGEQVKILGKRIQDFQVEVSLMDDLMKKTEEAADARHKQEAEEERRRHEDERKHWNEFCRWLREQEEARRRKEDERKSQYELYLEKQKKQKKAPPPSKRTRSDDDDDDENTTSAGSLHRKKKAKANSGVVDALSHSTA